MDKTKTFYVCSYGGSGSKMLCNALSKYGNVKHIHSKKPPDKLEYIGSENGGTGYSEWFNGIKIPENQVENYYVIFIYRNPSFAIESRFTNPVHLDHIQSNRSVKLKDVLSSGKDLYNVREFYDNYTKPNKNRNYKIYSIKYEEIFDRQYEISILFGIGILNMVNKSLKKNSNEKLNHIYSDLITEMNNNSFIMIS